MDVFDKLVCLNIILIVFFFSIILTDSVFAIDSVFEIWEEGQKECWDLLENANSFCLVFLQFIRKQLASQGKNKTCHLCVELSRSPTVLSHVFLFIRNQKLASPKIKKLLELQIILPILNKELSL